MRVRIERPSAAELRGAAARRRRLPRLASRLLGMIAAAAALLCVWRWSADFGLVASFPVEAEWARWQAWFAAAFVAAALAWVLAGGADSARRTTP